MTHAVDVLGRLNGRRKTLVYIGEGIDWGVTRQPWGDDLVDDIRGFIAAATRANARVYTIDPRGLAGHDEAVEMPRPLGLASDVEPTIRSLDADLTRSIDQLRSWAADTGGVSVVGTNDLNASLEQIARENRQYYLLGYASSRALADGRFHRIEVQVKRPGVTVRARRGYVAAAAAAGSGAGAARVSALEQAMAAPIGGYGVRLEAFAEPFDGTEGRAELLVGVLADGVDLDLQPDDGKSPAVVAFAIDAIDQSGRVVARSRNSVKMDLKPETRERARRLGVRFLDAVQLRPGRYELRVGAGDGEGRRTGTVRFSVEVPDFAMTPVALGGVLVALMRAPAPPGISTGTWFRDWLPAAPSLARSFAQDEELAVLTEIYARPDARGVGVRVTARVLDGRGDEVLTEESLVEASALEAAGGRHPFVARVPLADLDAGQYRLRIEARPAAASESKDRTPSTAGARREVAFRVTGAASNRLGLGF
jgi:hypothetical protein